MEQTRLQELHHTSTPPSGPSRPCLFGIPPTHTMGGVRYRADIGPIGLRPPADSARYGRALPTTPHRGRVRCGALGGG
jgi:hypothetical protein